MSLEPGPDAVRGYYARLGIDLSPSGHDNASCQCFANRNAHAHDDLQASCSVSLRHGAWRCWGCGARGGAFDAATSHGLTRRQAIDLLVDHGLAERRGAPTSSPPTAAAAAPTPPRPVPAVFDHPAAEQQRLQQQLAAAWETLPLRPEQRQLWRLAPLLELGCGWDGHRITLPVTDRAGDTVGLLRYLPTRPANPVAKVLADRGTRLHPLGVPAAGDGPVVLTEGIPDLLSARSAGLPAAGISGVQAWRAAFARRLQGHQVLIAFDADRPGRDAADQILVDLGHAGVDATVLDLAPDRADGYDLTNWLAARPARHPAAVLTSLADHAHRPTTSAAYGRLGPAASARLQPFARGANALSPVPGRLR